MIIDMHYHQIPMIPEELIPHTLEDPIRGARKISLDVDLDQLTARAKVYWSGPDGEKLLASIYQGSAPKCNGRYFIFRSGGFGHFRWQCTKDIRII